MTTTNDLLMQFFYGFIPYRGDIADYHLFLKKELELKAYDIIRQDTEWNYG